MTAQPAPEPRQAPTVKRVYSSDEIEVTWEPSLCIHVAACLRGAPRVFDAQRRPWIQLDAGAPEHIMTVVEQCPTGALHARWLDGRDEGGAAAETEVQVRRNGPLFVRGPVRVVDHLGETIREDTRIALCRCGASANKPFCDGSHLRIEFRA